MDAGEFTHLIRCAGAAEKEPLRATTKEEGRVNVRTVGRTKGFLREEAPSEEAGDVRCPQGRTTAV